MAAAKVADEGHVALALLFDRLDRNTRQLAVDLGAAAMPAGDVGQDGAQCGVLPGLRPALA